MLDDMDTILFPPATTAHIESEEVIEEISLDEMDAPEDINESESDVDWAVEFDETLTDDSDDFHEEQ